MIDSSATTRASLPNGLANRVLASLPYGSLLGMAAIVASGSRAATDKLIQARHKPE